MATWREGGGAGKTKRIDRGAYVPGQGVSIGTWSPRDRTGNSLNKTFNLFAAPYDLGLDENGNGKKQLLTYKQTVRAVSKLSNLMGHDGFKGGNDTDLYDALRDGSYKGEWFIPTRDILIGTDVNGDSVQRDTLYAQKDKGALKGTFPAQSNGSIPRWYLSCTERRRRCPSSDEYIYRDDSSGVYIVRFPDGGSDCIPKVNHSLSSRLVRAEPRP
jgi:hypothetical protein